MPSENPDLKTYTIALTGFELKVLDNLMTGKISIGKPGFREESEARMSMLLKFADAFTQYKTEKDLYS